MQDFKGTIAQDFEAQLKSYEETLKAELEEVKAKVSAKKTDVKKVFAHKCDIESEKTERITVQNAVREEQLSFDEEKQALFNEALDEIAKNLLTQSSYKKRVADALDSVSNKAVVEASAKTLIPTSYKGKVGALKDAKGVKITDNQLIIDLTVDEWVATNKDELLSQLHTELF